MSDKQSYSLGVGFTASHHYGLLEFILHNHLGTGIAVEFGVGEGTSTALIAEHLTVIGFDSFEGLPEDWREGYPKGSFACEEPIVDNAHFITGLFENTLEDWGSWENIEKVALVHIDCDLYSSTKTVFDHLGTKILTDKPVIVFDEWHGYEGCEKYEQRAWKEFAERTGVEWRVLGHGHQQWGIKIV